MPGKPQGGWKPGWAPDALTFIGFPKPNGLGPIGKFIPFIPFPKFPPGICPGANPELGFAPFPMFCPGICPGINPFGGIPAPKLGTPGKGPGINAPVGFPAGNGAAPGPPPCGRPGFGTAPASGDAAPGFWFESVVVVSIPSSKTSILGMSKSN